MPRSARSRWAGAILSGAAFLMSACGGAREETEAGGALERPNVLLIVVDTLGAEHTGAWAGLDHTPNIDRLASSGKRFEQAYATAPWTQPSMASLFTSMMPSRHRVRGLMDRLDAAAVTLAELLQGHGYSTHGIVSNGLIRGQLGFDQGFENYNESAIAGHDGITSEKVTNQAIRWLDNKASEPFFLLAHYFDPHALFHHHPEFDQTSGYEGPVEPAMEIWDFRDLRPEMQPADVDYLVGLHREEIAHTDHHVGRLLTHLEGSGLAERTLILFTSDHGEEFMRHGWIGHTRTLYNELLRVPLSISMPGVIAPGVVEQPVSLLDLLPTIAELVGLPAESGWEGASLVPVLRDEKGALPRTVFAEVSFAPKLQRGERAEEKTAFKTAVILDGLKLIHDELDGRWELYEYASDRDDVQNLWGQDPERDARLVEILARWEAGRNDPLDPESATIPLEDDAIIEELRKLGYIDR